MSPKSKRLSLTMPDHLVADAATIKQLAFNHQSNAEMYRQLIRLGLDTLKTANNSSPKETSSCPTIES